MLRLFDKVQQQSYGGSAQILAILAWEQEECPCV